MCRAQSSKIPARFGAYHIGVGYGRTTRNGMVRESSVPDLGLVTSFPHRLVQRGDRAVHSPTRTYPDE